MRRGRHWRRGGWLCAVVVCANVTAAVLSGCATVFNEPVNKPVAGDTIDLEKLQPPAVAGDTGVALAFSGGGTRAAAFSFGVLRGLDRISPPGGKSYFDRIVFISGVSGGSVTAAYFGLKGRAMLADFRERYLIRNPEETLTTDVNLGTLVQGLGGGVNDASRFPVWLDQHLFDGATMADLFRPGKPVVWINASDLYNGTPFMFTPDTFTALCSDFSQYPVSQAVAASAAVPIAFAPIVIESFPTACHAPLPPWVERAAADRNAGAQVRAFARALQRYRDPSQMRFVKLSDGGITDNFGLSGIVIARAAADKPFLPMPPDKAVQLRRLIFVVVNAGQEHEASWAKTVEGPSGAALIGAVTDTAIGSAVRSGFDAFRLTIREWEDAVRKWRCRLPQAQAQRLGARGDWRCSNIKFEIAEMAFDQFDAERRARLEKIPTRFKLATDDVDLLIQSGTDAVLNHPTFKGLAAATTASR